MTAGSDGAACARFLREVAPDLLGFDDPRREARAPNGIFVGASKPHTISG
jgi:hypothetical protein